MIWAADVVIVSALAFVFVVKVRRRRRRRRGTSVGSVWLARHWFLRASAGGVGWVCRGFELDPNSRRSLAYSAR